MSAGCSSPRQEGTWLDIHRGKERQLKAAESGDLGFFTELPIDEFAATVESAKQTLCPRKCASKPAPGSLSCQRLRMYPQLLLVPAVLVMACTTPLP